MPRVAFALRENQSSTPDDRVESIFLPLWDEDDRKWLVLALEALRVCKKFLKKPVTSLTDEN